MKIAITDANIFIDLIRLELLGYLFNLGMEIHTTREVYDQLNSHQREVAAGFVQAGVLSVYSFSYQELEEIELLECPAGLEMADRTVYYYSKRIEALVLSGDKKLRTFCLNQDIDVRGILWLFDLFLERGLITKIIAVEKLKFLLSFNDRLPMDQCQQRLNSWGE